MNDQELWNLQRVFHSPRPKYDLLCIRSVEYYEMTIQDTVVVGSHKELKEHTA